MTEQISAKPRARLFYLDNLRIYLTILVVLHHAALAYGGAGNWGVKDPAVDDISPIFLFFFNAVNQSYFMSAFFLLAGYFTPRSFERKGSKQFLIDRLIRLGIPIAIYTTILININEYILDVWYRDSIYNIKIEYDPGPLWLVQALLFFAAIYVIFRALADRSATKKSIQLYRDTFPPDAILFLCIGILTVLTFLEHLVFPVGKAIFLNFQAGFFVHYTFCFYIGVLAYRGDWFVRLSKAQARRWGILSLVVIPLYFVMMVLGGALESEENVAKFTGGLYWQSFALSLWFWFTFLMVGIIVFLLYFFRERLNQAGPMAKTMAANVYTVYIIHQTVLYALNILLLDINIPTILKFFIAGLIAVPVCFVLSGLIRRIPYARRVLG
jgi:glucan biosynthesis protein C